MNNIEWKWSNGEKYERSSRVENKNRQQEIQHIQYSKETENSAYIQSLHYDENNWETNSSFLINNETFVRGSNKREDTDNKLSERQMFAQVNMNPYLSNNNYLEDLNVRDTYLKPKSTIAEKEIEHK